MNRETSEIMTNWMRQQSRRGIVGEALPEAKPIPATKAISTIPPANAGEGAGQGFMQPPLSENAKMNRLIRLALYFGD